jgi:hypothetical protein
MTGQYKLSTENKVKGLFWRNGIISTKKHHPDFDVYG